MVSRITAYFPCADQHDLVAARLLIDMQRMLLPNRLPIPEMPEVMIEMRIGIILELQDISFTQHRIGRTKGYPIILFWNFGEGSALATADRTLSHAYDLPGVKAIEVTLHFRAYPEPRLQDQLTVHPLPVVDLGPDTTICAGAPVRYLSNRAPGGEGYRYLWNTGAVTPELPLRQEGLYNLVVTTPWGCAGSDEVRVARGCYLDIPNAFSPNGDGVNDYFSPVNRCHRGSVPSVWRSRTGGARFYLSLPISGAGVGMVILMVSLSLPVCMYIPWRSVIAGRQPKFFTEMSP
jgi:hypothetical protein